MRCMFLIFNPELICTVTLCTKFNADTGITLNIPNANIYIVYIKQGSLDVFLDSGKTNTVKSGELLILNNISSIDVHSKSIGIFLCLSGSAALEMSGNINSAIQLNVQAKTDITNLLNNIETIYSKNNNKAPFLLGFELLCKLAYADEILKNEKTPTIVIQAIYEMQNNYAYLYGIDELSRNLGVSKNHLVRMFTKHLNISAGKYLTNVKVNAAKQFLLSTNYQINIISDMCGFTSSNYFCKVFKNSTGVTPDSFRLQNKATNNLDINIEALENDFYV